MASTPLIDRRHFLKAAGMAFVSVLPAETGQALERSDAVFAAGFRERDGAYGLALVSESGEILAPIALPDRAHGVCHCRISGRVVTFARRPGTFAAIIEPKAGHHLTVISTPEGRHFYGHGRFSPNGRVLYASENDFEHSRGVIGLYDAGDQFRRIGEFDAFGVGTHDMTISDDGAMLIIANGGIETHPDFGRTKLNLDRMEPSLVLLDARNGTLIEKHILPARLSRLSTRHVETAANGRIWFACQYEGPRNELLPLVGYFSRGEEVVLVTLPDEVTAQLANYVGAIAVNRRDGLVGITSPRGGVEVVIDGTDGKVVLVKQVPDAAGIAPARTGFAVSSYRGMFAGTDSNLAWDQHIARLA